jgi:uncharacterized protein (DUF488 family)
MDGLAAFSPPPPHPAASIASAAAASAEIVDARCRGRLCPCAILSLPKAMPSSETYSGVRQAATIGVYGFTAERFLETLHNANVRQLLDVRQRRGVRGPEYAWANAGRLQAALQREGVDYRHHKELAPTTELRHLQYREDEKLGVGKRSRVELAPEYVERYTREILDHVDLLPILDEMPAEGVAALFCVERDPEACHRSLIAARLAAQYRVSVTHLRP